MAFVITQACIGTTDQACVEVCPVDCIHFEQGTDAMLYINPLECIDCGACQPACPVTAIFAEADVPAEMQRFTALNALWYSDAASARAQVGGSGTSAGAAAAAPAPPPAAGADAADSPAAEAGAAAASAPAAAVAVANVRRNSQVPAEEPHPHGNGPIVPHYNQPSKKAMVALFGLIFAAALMFAVPGPELLTIPGVGGVHLGLLLFTPLAMLFLIVLLSSQVTELGRFAATHERSTNYWREGRTIWRRGEEARRYDQAQAVKALVDSRFAFPTVAHPSYRTHVNVPEPTMAIEFGGGGGEKVFPDILVVDYPGNYPVMVAQVETRESVTRQQAERVWKQLETAEAPLYIYVPSGMGTVARDYARAAGIEHAEVRTWRRQPGTVLVEEI